MSDNDKKMKTFVNATVPRLSFCLGFCSSFFGTGYILKNAFEKGILLDVNDLTVGGTALVCIGLTLKAFEKVMHLYEENDSDSESQSE